MLIVDVVLCFLLIAFLRPGGCKPTAIRHATLLYPVLLSHDMVVPFSSQKTTTFPYDSASSLSLSLSIVQPSHISLDLVSLKTWLVFSRH